MSKVQTSRGKNITKLVILYANSKAVCSFKEKRTELYCWQNGVKKLLAWDGSLAIVPRWGWTLIILQLVFGTLLHLLPPS